MHTSKASAIKVVATSGPRGSSSERLKPSGTIGLALRGATKGLWRGVRESARIGATPRIGAGRQTHRASPDVSCSR
eukprot:2435514-Alexandrium_andersonii.AAC.1